MRGWLVVDAQAATAWAQTIEDPTCRDACLSAVVTSTGLENPSWALTVAGKISDANQRDTATISVINHAGWSPAGYGGKIELGCCLA
jgi:hypothetical protein